MKLDSLFNKVLITGINGFTGVHLERYLTSQGFDVFGTVIDTPKSQNHFQCDIRYKNEINNIISNIKPDYVIHIAAISFVAESDASLIYAVNVLGTENLLSALVENKITPKKVILASSATVYGNQGTEILDESMCPKPVNHYGISKLSMEYVASTYVTYFPIIISRPFNYTGIGQEAHFLIPKIIASFSQKSPNIELGNLHVSREFNDIENVVDIYHRLLLSTTPYAVVNIASNKPRRLLEIIETMNALAGYKIEVTVNPLFVRDNEISSLAGSTEYLNSLIGETSYIPIKKTLQKMYLHALEQNT